MIETETRLQVELANRIQNVGESATLQITRKVEELRAKGRNILSLSTGEPDYPTPENVKQAGKRAIDENFTRYTAAEGIFDLRKALAEKFWNDNNIRTAPDRVQ